MPKNPLKGFVRRKSSGNILDLQAEQPGESDPAAPASSSFRVLERPEKAGPNGVDRRTVSQRPVSALPFHSSKGKSTEDLSRSTNRGSGTTTLSGSSGYYDTSSSSARHSSSSTLPSSLDQEHEAAQDDMFSSKGAQAQSQLHYNQAQVPPQSYSPSGMPNASFATRASRAISFGRRKTGSPAAEFDAASQAEAEAAEMVPALPDLPDHAAIRDRDRATTISSYASTAVAPRLEANLGQSDFSDFGNMFEGLSNSTKETALPPPPRVVGGYLRSESEPMFPPRAVSRPTATPSPEPTYEAPAQLPIQRMNRPQQLAPTKRYSWQSRTSHDGLISPTLDADMSSPYSSEFSQDTVKPPTAGFSRFNPGYQPVPARYASPASEIGEPQRDASSYTTRQPARQVSTSSDEYSSEKDDDKILTSRMQSKAPVSSIRQQYPSHPSQGPPPPPVVQHPAVVNARDDMSSTGSSADGSSSLGRDSRNTTPRANKTRSQLGDASLFDVSPAGPASRALYSSPQARGGASNPASPKKMTKAQFELQRAAPEDDQSETSDASDDGYDDGDEEERQAELTRQRRKQEANLAVYRQQMQKVSGGQAAELASQMQRTSLTASMLPHGISDVAGEGEEEDEDVPLGILAAHGFPNKNRPPVRFSGGPTTPGSQAGDPMAMPGMGGALPPFARRLPQMPPDPYYGASLVSPTHRETLAFGGNPSGGSVYGGAPAVQPVQGGGGLVGVIAGEERARAARRASPNPINGGYGPMPLPSNMQVPPSMMPRTMSMGMMSPPQMGSFMPPMMSPMAMDQSQQMMQMMQMQQQMMQSIIQMQAGQAPNFALPQSQSQQSLGNGFLNPNMAQRPVSMASNVNTPGRPNNTGRSMTMNLPPPQWNDNSAQGRSNTMGSTGRQMGYAGSVYNFNLSAPAPGYTPSIAPSERSNVGMPSRYRPVSTMEANGAGSRTQTMNSSMGQYMMPEAAPAAAQAPKSTIRVIDKPKGTPRSPPARGGAEEEDEDEGWAQMRQKREARKRRGTMQQNAPTPPALSELYTSVE